ncbi:MAG: hypothetical protein QOH24_1075 [Verrucomicrobiota bacterium]
MDNDMWIGNIPMPKVNNFCPPWGLWKLCHPIFPRDALASRMSKQQLPHTARTSGSFGQASARMERYCTDHPRSPSAVRRPQLCRSGDTFVALLGQNLQTGIAGIGNTVESALRAFDLQYLRALRPPPARTSSTIQKSAG